jgi:hypothetical protein
MDTLTINIVVGVLIIIGAFLIDLRIKRMNEKLAEMDKRLQDHVEERKSE